MEGRTRPLTGDVPPGGNEFVFWYPDLTRLGLRASAQDDFLDRLGAERHKHQVRYVMDLNVASNVECYTFQGTGPHEFQRIRYVVGRAIEKFGGYAVVFVPETTRRYAVPGPNGAEGDANTGAETD